MADARPSSSELNSGALSPRMISITRCQKRRGQAYENRRLEGSHECYPSTRWICCCDCCCLIHQSCLGVLRPSSRAAVSPGPHPITMCYHSGHAVATRPPSYVQQGLWSIADRAL
jgi:hypothetical protein